MFAETKAMNSFAVDDVQKAREFYGETLGIGASVFDDTPQALVVLQLSGDRDTIVYEKPDFTPATYTVLNFAVEDIDSAVEDLSSRGVSFERYEGFDQDEKGIARGNGPDIAWFKDPAGNILAVLQDSQNL
jgi:predicted enzyme related to lactoylglutathione lyase